jgi:hypothetical protein
VLLSAVSPSSAAAAAAAAAASSLPPQLRDLYGANPGAHHPLASLVTQQSRLLELSRFGLRHYDLAQHMLTQQGAVNKLLGEYQKSKPTNITFIQDRMFYDF